MNAFRGNTERRTNLHRRGAAMAVPLLCRLRQAPEGSSESAAEGGQCRCRWLQSHGSLGSRPPPPPALEQHPAGAQQHHTSHLMSFRLPATFPAKANSEPHDCIGAAGKDSYPWFFQPRLWACYTLSTVLIRCSAATHNQPQTGKFISQYKNHNHSNQSHASFPINKSHLLSLHCT